MLSHLFQNPTNVTFDPKPSPVGGLGPSGAAFGPRLRPGQTPGHLRSVKPEVECQSRIAPGYRF